MPRNLAGRRKTSALKRLKKSNPADEQAHDAATRRKLCQSIAAPYEIALSPARASKQLRDIGAQLPGERHAASFVLSLAPLAKIPASVPIAAR
jgi:hypothetical protein